jgi:hypothetical protein
MRSPAIFWAISPRNVSVASIWGADEDVPDFVVGEQALIKVTIRISR